MDADGSPAQQEEASLGTAFVLTASELDDVGHNTATVTVGGDEVVVPVQWAQLRLSSDARDVVVERLDVQVGQAPSPAGWWVEGVQLRASGVLGQVVASSPRSMSLDLEAPVEVATSASGEEHAQHHMAEAALPLSWRIDVTAQDGTIQVVASGKSAATRSDSPCCWADHVALELGLRGDLTTAD